MKLYSCLKPELIKLDCTAKTTEEILNELLGLLVLKAKLPNQAWIFEKLMEREKLGSTSIGNHAAVPHTKLKELKEPVICIGVSPDGIAYHEADKEKVHIIILILSPNYSPIIHLQILAAAASLIKRGRRFTGEMLSIKTPQELISLIKDYESSNDQE